MHNPENIFARFPVIELDETYYLRGYHASDKKDYFSYMDNEKVIEFIPEECIPRTMERAGEEVQYVMDLFNYRRSVYWALALKSNDRLIGSCGFNYWSRDHDRAEISYDLSHKYWGKGIITKAVKAVLGYGFIQMNLNRIEATVAPENKASIAVLEKLGFQKEGLLREQKKLHGKPSDAVIYSVLKREFIKL